MCFSIELNMRKSNNDTERNIPKCKRKKQQTRNKTNEINDKDTYNVRFKSRMCGAGLCYTN